MLETTNQCNFDCIMCERRINKPDDLMSREIFDMAMSKLSPGFVAVEISGLGEPTLSPDFNHHVGSIQTSGKILYFPTNGSGLKGDKLEQLRNSDLTRVNFSMDAATEETYGKVRVDKQGKAANFSELVRTVKKFRSAKPAARLITSFTAASYNIDEFPLFVKQAVDLGANQVAFKPARCWALKPEEFSLRYFKDRTERAIEDAMKAVNDSSVSLTIERPYYAAGFENAGNIPGFINYLDILPLDALECGGGGGSGGGETMTYITVTTSAPITEEFVGGIEIFDYRSLLKQEDEIKPSDNVVLVTTDGIICSCAARHPIGDVREDDFKSVILNPRYQQHLAARSEGRALDSPWCKSCEKMM